MDLLCSVGSLQEGTKPQQPHLALTCPVLFPSYAGAWLPQAKLSVLSALPLSSHFPPSCPFFCFILPPLHTQTILLQFLPVPFCQAVRRADHREDANKFI